MRAGVLAGIGAALAGSSLSAAATDGPSLGTARDFAVLGGSTVSSTGFTAVSGNVGVSPGTEIAGFPPATLARGELHAGDAVAATAHADAAIAYAFLEGMPSIPANNLTDTDLGGLTLAPGVYKFNASAQLTGALVLDAQGDRRALFVIQVASALTTASGSSVVVIHGGANYDESHVYWQIGSSATLGAGTAFTGNVLAYSSITLVTGSSLKGSALALNGAVTLDGNDVTLPPVGRVQGPGQPSSGKTTLSPPVGGPDSNDFARINVRHFSAFHAREERSWIRAKFRHLDSRTDYTLWADDPSTPGTELVQFEAFSTKHSRNFNYRKDTKKGDLLPFGATLAALGGMAIEVRDSAGTTTLLTGRIPVATR